MVTPLVDTGDQPFPEGVTPLQTTTSLESFSKLGLVELTISIEVKLLEGPSKVVSSEEVCSVAAKRNKLGVVNDTGGIRVHAVL